MTGATASTAGLRDRVAQQAQPGTAVERVEVEVPAGSAPAAIRKAIETQSKAFHAVLPNTVDAERFSRLVLTAVKASPDLMNCFGTTQGQTSLLLAAMQAAAMGLEPNTPKQHCWLLPRKRGQVQECELQIGYRGYLHLARRSGTVKSIYAQVVRQGDHFRYERGLHDDVLEWRPAEDDDGEMTHAFAVVRYLNGGSNFVVLTKKKVLARRAISPSFNAQHNSSSPWIKWPEEMWCKTAIRALIPHLELDEQLTIAEALDEQTLRMDDEGVIDVAVAGELPAGSPEGDGEQAQGAEGAPAEPPDGASSGEPAPSPSGVDEPPSTSEHEPPTQAQMRALHRLLKQKLNVEGDGRHATLTNLLARPIGSANDVTKDEASRLIDELNDEPNWTPDGQQEEERQQELGS